jgi:dTDP-4-dehydrorhamnose 3,5-epimerase-like enzyme
MKYLIWGNTHRKQVNLDHNSGSWRVQIAWHWHLRRDPLAMLYRGEEESEVVKYRKGSSTQGSYS